MVSEDEAPLKTPQRMEIHRVRLPEEDEEDGEGEGEGEKKVVE